MADPLEILKQIALQRAMQNQQPQLASASMGDNGVPQLPQGQAPQVQMQQPNVGAQSPQVQPVQTQPGPIKSFLSQFIYGAGQGLVKHAGLETDAERQQRQLQNQLAQQSGQRAGALQQAQIGFYNQRGDALDAENQQVDTSKLGIPGLTGMVLQKDLPKVIGPYLTGQAGITKGQNTNASNQAIAALKYGDGAQPGPLNTVIKDIGGRSLLLRKGTGEVLKDLGQANSITTAGARAQAMAQYGLTDTMDEGGNPVGISRLSALQQGAPSVSFDALKQIGSDKVGIQQYESILKNQISPNLSVLNDPVQRGIIAHTLNEADKNPGAIQSLLTAGAQSGLSPQGAALAAGILQGREFGSVARKYGGNMNGTEGLMNRIMSNQASPLNSEQLNRDLIQNDLTFTGNAQKQLGKLTSHRSNTPTPAPAQPSGAATHRFNPATGKIEVIQ